MHPKATDIWAAFSSSGVSTWCNFKTGSSQEKEQSTTHSPGLSAGLRRTAQAAEGIYPPGAQFTHTSLLQGTRQTHTNPLLLLQSTGTTALLRLGLTPSSDSPQHLCAPQPARCDVLCSCFLQTACTRNKCPVLLPLWSILDSPSTCKPLSAGTVAAGQSTLCLTPMSTLEIFKVIFSPLCFLVFLFKKGLFTFTLHCTSQFHCLTLCLDRVWSFCYIPCPTPSSSLQGIRKQHRQKSH